ncbi:tape measure protein [Streptococcus uberis]|uniref:tape measure protein n=1 Tax=Streptococcus uberis TaxID=1349 RepID=UPI0020BDE18D|nr:tape measure protein [Streptococcus uberis]
MAKVQAQMSTEIALDLVKASESIKSMTNLVNTSTNAWKAQESQLKMTGDYLGATKAKYEGLGSSIQAQQAKIEALKQKQSELKGDTQQTAEQYLKFQQQIDQATTKLSSLEVQQNKAKQSMSYYQSGLADLQKGYRQQNDLSESYVKRLQAEGRENEALQAKLNGSKTAVNNLNKQYEAQVKMLKEVAQSGDGDAYVKQKQRINETATALAHAKTEQKELASELRKSNPTFFDKLKTGIHETNSKIDELGRNVNRSNSLLGTFREKLSFGAIAGMASSAIQSISSFVMGLSGEVLATSDSLEKFESTMNFADKSKKETEEASKYFKTYADKTVYELQDVANTGAQLASNGIENYKEITIASGNLNAIAGGNKETFKSLGMVLTQTAGAGKLTTENWNQLADAIPGASGKLQETLSKNGAFVGNFREAMENGEITSEEFLTAIEQLGNNKGAEKAAKSTKTFEGAFGSLKSTVVNGLNDMVGIVGKENITKSITGFGDTIKDVFDYLKDHKKELSSIGKSVFEISKIFGMAVWDTAKGIIVGISDSINAMNGHSKKSKDPLKNIASALKEVSKHKDAIKTVGKVFVAYFASKAVLNTSKSLFGTITGGISDVKKAGSGVNGALNWVMGVRGEDAVNNKLGGIKKIGRGTKSAFKWTASVATKTAKLALTGLLNTAKFVGNGIKLAFNFAKANPMILIATAVIGVSIALYELYKHNKKFKGFVDGLVKSVKDFSKGVVEKFKDGFKAVVKAGKATIDFFKKDWKEILLFLINPVAGGFALIYKHNKKFKDFVDGIWKTAQNFGKTFWKGLTGFFGNIGKKLDSGYDKVTDFIGKIKSKTTDMWSHIKNGFKSMWDGMKQLAGTGINAVIKIPNAGISGINNLIADFGGSKNAIGKIPEVKFATGTGMFSNVRRAITQPTLAMLNDGHDSPETGHQEAVIMPNGEMVLPQGRNKRMILPAGAEVLNATELKMLMSMSATPFANGTGFWSKLWDSTTSIAGNAWDGIKDTAKKFTEMLGFIGGAIKDPAGTLAKKFNPNANKLDGVFNPLGNALFKTPKAQAKGWWSELWNMANEASNAGGRVMGAVGDDYPAKWKAMGKDAIADPWGYFIRECVSFVANRLNNSGVNPSLFSGLGNGNQWVSARVPHMSKPKIGSVAVYGPGSEFGNHVAMVTGVNGDKYSGEEYNWSGDGLYHTYANRLASRATTFLDFGLRGKTEDSEGVKANTGLQKLIKKQVGGMFDWITKFLAPETDADPSGGGGATGVERWRSSVIKALKKNGFDATDSQVSAWMRVIQRESNGNPKAVNNWDSNAMAGIPSKGLVQTIEPTFNAYKHKGHDNIFNGYDNLLAGIAYMKARYGSDASAFARVSGPMGYANGGLVSKNGIYELAEGNMPEYIIPTDMAKRGRAWSLLAEVVGKFAGEAPKPQGGNDSNAIHDLEAKFDTMISLLAQLVQGQNNQPEIKPIIDASSVTNALAPKMQEALDKLGRRNMILGGANIR